METIESKNKIITPAMYLDMRQEHPYIPQADKCIINIVDKFFASVRGETIKILDLGCGPGALTARFAVPDARVLGIDISPDSIAFARAHETKFKNLHNPIEFWCMDFITDEFNIACLTQPPFDVIVMQNVMNDIHDDDRAKFLQKSFDLLNPGGLLIVGEEFIPQYKDIDEHITLAAKYYLHIIAEALKGGFTDLAEREAENLIADALWTDGAVCSNPQALFKDIFGVAERSNDRFFHGGHERCYFSASAAVGMIRDKAKRVQLSQTDSARSLKKATEFFIAEMYSFQFQFQNKYEFGYVDLTGGMNVLCFTKR